MNAPHTSRPRPALTVVMPFWNARETLAEAVLSVLRQTWPDFELLLFDDGSDDGSSDVAANIKDARVRLVRSDRHTGYAALLNQGIAEARAELIARMDADDISHPTRFAMQVGLLRQNPGIDLCGTWARCFDATGTLHDLRPPTGPDDVSALALHAAPFVHPSVMFRREAVPSDGQAYDPSYSPAEDYHLWARLLVAKRGANIPRLLLRYRRSPGQATQVMAPQKHLACAAVRRRQLERLALSPDAATFALHEAIFDGRWTSGQEFAASAMAWLGRLARANDENAAFPRKALRRQLALYARNICQVGVRPGRRAWRMYRDSELGAELSAVISAARILCRI